MDSISLYKLPFYKKMSIPGYRAIQIYRLYNKFNNKKFIGRALSSFFFNLNLALHSIEINPNAVLGKNIYFPHTTGIVIGPTKIGDNVTIYQNVTIGHSNGSAGGLPVIEDNVSIYAGAVIVGDIVIRKNSRVGANSVVLQDVPENSLAVGVPARIIHK